MMMKTTKPKKPKVILLSPSDVKVTWRARSDLGDLNGLIGSISSIGQLHPIVVKAAGKTYELIAGERRLTACEKLKRQVVAAVLSPGDELTELDMQLSENVKRKDFDKLELGRGLKRRKPLYEKANPESKIGVTGGKGKAKRTKDDFPHRGKSSPAKSFADSTAETLGLGKTVVYDCMSLADLPRNQQSKIEKAKTTSERNKLSLEALRGVRQSRKRQKLEARAAAAKKQRAEATDVAVEIKAPVVLRMMDNRDYFKEAEPGTFDLILTDPPYETLRESLISHVKRGSIKTDFGAWDKLDIGWVLKALPMLNENGQMLICSPLEAIGDYRTILESVGMTYRGAIIWHKTNPGVVHRPTYLSSVEAIVWATRADKYYFTPWENSGAREVHNHIEGPICGGDERTAHPTQKPEWLIDDLLERHALSGGRVLDPFAGAGTTLVCCKRRGLEAVGVELSPEYVHLARLRLESL